MDMKIDFDKQANAAYLCLKEIQPGEVKKTISLNESINLDLDLNGKILGIEVLNATKQLPLSLLS